MILIFLGRVKKGAREPSICNTRNNIPYLWSLDTYNCVFCIEKPGHLHNTARSWFNAALESAIFKIMQFAHLWKCQKMTLPKICWKFLLKWFREVAKGFWRLKNSTVFSRFFLSSKKTLNRGLTVNNYPLPSCFNGLLLDSLG